MDKHHSHFLSHDVMLPEKVQIIWFLFGSLVFFLYCN